MDVATEAFRLRLKQARRESGLTLDDVAARLGVSRQIVSAWEAGDKRPMLDRVSAIAEALGKSPAWFFMSPDEERAQSAREEAWTTLSPAEQAWYKEFAEATREYGLGLGEFDLRGHPGVPKWYLDWVADWLETEHQAKAEVQIWNRDAAPADRVAEPTALYGSGESRPAEAGLASLVAEAVAQAMAPLIQQQTQALEQQARALEALQKESQITRLRYEDLVRQVKGGNISNGSYFRSRPGPTPGDAAAEGGKG
jgi:transcriptional regulator with XRE-family HTH domain